MSASTPSFNPGDVQKLAPVTSNLFPTTHKSSYPSLSPLRPELNQSGKTVLVTGASAGIRFAIAKAFAEASASRVALTDRRSDVLQRAASQFSTSFPKTEFVARVCDIGNLAESAALWSGLHADGIFVDVLVLNTAKFHGQETLLEVGLDATWSLYDTNVRSLLDFRQ